MLSNLNVMRRYDMLSRYRHVVKRYRHVVKLMRRYRHVVILKRYEKI